MHRSFSKFQRPMASAALKLARRAAFSAPHSSSRHGIGHPMAFTLRKASASRSGQAAEKRDVVSSGIKSARALCTPAATASDDTQLLDAYSRAITSVVVSTVYRKRFFIFPLHSPPSFLPLFPTSMQTPTLNHWLSPEQGRASSRIHWGHNGARRKLGFWCLFRARRLSPLKRAYAYSPPSSFASPPRHIPAPPHQHKNVAPSALLMPCHATKIEKLTIRADVVGSAPSVQVTLTDGRRLTADVVGTGIC
jgi:hypothetical protein